MIDIELDGNHYHFTPAQLAEFSPYLRFAQSTYCPPEALDGWKCGSECPDQRFQVSLSSRSITLEPCDEVPDFHLSLVGGNGDSIQTCE
jgi:hypothetical protein